LTTVEEKPEDPGNAVGKPTCEQGGDEAEKLFEIWDSNYLLGVGIW